MKKSLIYSLLLHLALIILFSFDLPRFSSPKRPPLPSGIQVSLSQEKTAAKKAPKKVKKKVKKTIKKRQSPPPVPPKPIQPKVRPKAKTKAKTEAKKRQAPPVQKVSSPQPDTKPKAKPAHTSPAPKPTPKAAKKPMPPSKPPSPAKQTSQKKPKDDFYSVLKDLRNTASVDKTKGKPPRAPPSTAETPATMTDHEMAALKSQVAACWSFPAGARHAEDLSVDIRVEVNPDRTVKAAYILNQDRYHQDPFFRVAADSAKRALFDDRCRPLALPPEKYHEWKSFVFRFDPKEML